MSFFEISREEFDSLDIARTGFFPERAWFRSTELDLAGTVILDPFDKDWSYVLLSKDEDGAYRYIDGEVSLSSQQEAESKLYIAASRIEASGSFKEEFYAEPEST